MGFEKEGRKTSTSNKVYETPPPGPQINAWIFCSQKTWENIVFSEFGVFSCPSISHSSVVFKGSPKKYSQGFFGTPKGWPRNREKLGFCRGCVVSVFYHFVSSWSPVVFAYLVVCKCIIHPCFLTLLLCFPSLRWLCFLVSIHLHLCCVLYISFNCLSLLSSLLVWEQPDQMRKYLTILFSCLCFSACIPTLSLRPTNNPTRPREVPLEMVYFVLFLAQ